MAIDTGLIGSVINALPMDRMITAPLMAMMQAQAQASKQYADFLLTVCVRDGQAVAIDFNYDQTFVDTEGQLTGVEQRKMRIPLLAAISHPNICIEEGVIDFQLEVSQAEEEHKSTDAGADLQAKLGWGILSLQISGKVSHKEEQTRKTDTRAKYGVHVTAKRQPPPEALMRVIDTLTDAAVNPVRLSQITDKAQVTARLADKSGLYLGRAPDWAKDTEYAVGQRVTSDGGIYECGAPGKANVAPTGKKDATDANLTWKYLGPA